VKKLVAAIAIASALLLAGGPSAEASGTCSVASLAKDSRLKSFAGYVSTMDGTKLFSRSGTTALPEGSVHKLLTAAAAIEVLGPKYRLKTTVVKGKKAGTIVLVGGGDPTLSRVSSSFYPGAPKLSDLASQVKKSMKGTKITKIVLDASYWDPTDNWDSTWARSEQRIGYLSETTALQVDGDRANPRSNVSPRSTDPVKKAGQYFAKALGLSNVKIVKGTAPDDTELLASVTSQPISSLIKTMLLSSDGTLAESIARVVSVKSGADGSAKSLKTVLPAALAGYGLDTSKLKIRDGSGLSTKNGVSPKFVTQLLREIYDGPHKLRYVYNGLSVAGRTGSLASRFTGSAAVARGSVWAKTGWLDTEYSLAGIVKAKDGTRMAFAFYAIRNGISPSAKVALDNLVAGVYRCGSRLSNG
jgi:D-alanyl-D-alanine carboxypeptidase/D-alanyl-D-alanine-endopeptidase (penicillin-binding protein 4)